MKAITISTAEDVAALAKDIRTGKRRLAREIVIKLEGVNKSQVDQISEELNRNYFSCGCNEATALGLLGLVAALISVSIQLETWHDISWQHGIIVIGIFIIATGFGKAIGRYRARRAMTAAVKKLMSFTPKVKEIGKGDGSALCAVGNIEKE